MLLVRERCTISFVGRHVERPASFVTVLMGETGHKGGEIGERQRACARPNSEFAAPNRTNNMESENSFWNRRDFLKVGGTSAAALGMAGTAAVPTPAAQAPAAPAGMAPDTP